MVTKNWKKNNANKKLMNVVNVSGKHYSCKDTILPLEEGENTHNSTGILAYKII